MDTRALCLSLFVGDMASVASRAAAAAESPVRVAAMQGVRWLSTAHHRREAHEFAEPSEYLGSWGFGPSGDPEEAQRRLALLRRQYKKEVKEMRRQYLYEMEMQRVERLRKEEAKREAIRLAREERKAAKSAIAQTRAAERKLFLDQLHQTLMEERAEKMKLWKAREAAQEQKKKDESELLRQQSSTWIDENELEKKIFEAVVTSTRL